MSQKLIALAAWASFAILAYAPLTHVGFVYSVYFNLAPLLMTADVRTCVHFEHVTAFAIFGAIFAFTYPKRINFVCSVVFLSAIPLEYLQTFTPDRHGTIMDCASGNDSEHTSNYLFESRINPQRRYQA